MRCYPKTADAWKPAGRHHRRRAIHQPRLSLADSPATVAMLFNTATGAVQRTAVQRLRREERRARREITTAVALGRLSDTERETRNEAHRHCHPHALPHPRI